MRGPPAKPVPSFCRLHSCGAAGAHAPQLGALLLATPSHCKHFGEHRTAGRCEDMRADREGNCCMPRNFVWNHIAPACQPSLVSMPCFSQPLVSMPCNSQPWLQEHRAEPSKRAQAACQEEVQR